ncbi:glutathione S-transferase family protein [Limnohabitans sp. Bal53]|uniref:glutathione S-transferase family protein n=1 Tax=Limnohabitans sp. Bal53 TaxID=1977910 RepID=UPI000D3C027D|nr:glutathione S-transferase family protein [Limnohabitans sp. Bal53]PUE41701.1 glutathione S-transferase [Limnohabitans sp. Bal53]
MTLKIYGISASRAARPLWAALELGVPFEHIDMNYKAGATRTPEFLALNPNGHVPVVVDDRPEGTVTVWESMACALYIARVHGHADGQSITPASPREEAEALRWSFWTVTELEKDALTVLMHRMAMPADQRKPELAEQAENRLKVPLAVLEAHLQAQHVQGQAHLAADRFTVADVCVASVANWIRPAPGLLAQYPAVSAWLQACMAREGQKQVRALP